MCALKDSDADGDSENSSDFELRPQGSCSVSVQTQEACKAAAIALGKRSGPSHTSDISPPGCYFDGVSNRVVFNKARTIKPCTSKKQCICDIRDMTCPAGQGWYNDKCVDCSAGTYQDGSDFPIFPSCSKCLSKHPNGAWCLISSKNTQYDCANSSVLPPVFQLLSGNSQGDFN